MVREGYRSYLMSTSAAWCILPLHMPPSSSSPLSIFFFTAALCLSRAPRIRQSPPFVSTPVVAPKRRLASLPAPPPTVLSHSLSLALSPAPHPLTNDKKKKHPLLPSPSPCRSFSLLLLLPLTQNSVCLFPKPRHCRPYDITQLPYMGNSGLP